MLSKPFVPKFTISAVRVVSDSVVCNRSIGNLRKAGVLDQPILAIQRGDEVVTTPSDGIVLQKDDVLVVMAQPEQFACSSCVFEPGDTTEITPGSGN